MTLPHQTTATERPRERQTLLGLLRISRPKQWVKNIYLFAAVVFAGEATDPATVGTALVAFLLWCAASSSVYVLNDLSDEARDRLHPKKRFRPLPSGRLTRGAAWAYLLALVAIWTAGAFWLSRPFGALLALYFGINVLYSFKLKQIFLVDVIVVAFGFVLRAVGGAVLIQVPVSPWLFVCTILISLFLALGKRRNELTTLKANATDHRQTLEMYTVALTDQLITIVAAGTLVAYSLYSFYASPEHTMLWTVPFVVYGLFRYLYLIQRDDLVGSPEEALLSDWPSLLNLLLWGSTVLLILYGPKLPFFMT